MEFKDALAQAADYFYRTKGTGVICALDAKTHWIFYGGIKGKVEIGGTGIKIEKETGRVEDFILPDSEHFKMLENAEEIKLF